MKVIYNNIIPVRGFAAINLFGIVFAREDCFPDRDMNLVCRCHEYTHTLQMREMLYVFFYLWYAVEWVIRLVFQCKFNSNLAYHMISFEREAYNHQYDHCYNDSRRHYSWMKYL